LYHFIGRSIESKDEQYKLMTKVLKESWLTSPPHENFISPGQIKIDSFRERKISEMFNPRCVCFADIPKDELKIHMKKSANLELAYQSPFWLRKVLIQFFISKKIHRHIE
jgi:hypothetical protein